MKLSNAIPEGVRQAKRRRVYHGVGCGTLERSKTSSDTPPASPAAAERRELVSLLIPTCRSTHENTLNGARAALVLRLGARHRSHYVRGDHDLDRSRITSTATTAEDRRRDDAPQRSNATTQQRDDAATRLHRKCHATTPPGDEPRPSLPEDRSSPCTSADEVPRRGV